MSDLALRKLRAVITKLSGVSGGIALPPQRSVLGLQADGNRTNRSVGEKCVPSCDNEISWTARVPMSTGDCCDEDGKRRLSLIGDSAGMPRGRGCMCTSSVVAARRGGAVEVSGPWST